MRKNIYKAASFLSDTLNPARMETPEGTVEREVADFLYFQLEQVVQQAHLGADDVIRLRENGLSEDEILAEMRKI